ITNSGANSTLQGDSISLTAGSSLNNQDSAQIQASDALTAHAQTITNSNASLSAGWSNPNGSLHLGDISLNASGAITNSQSNALILATGNLTLQAGSLSNTDQALIAGGGLSLTSQTFLNDNAQIQGIDTLNLSSATLTNRNGARIYGDQAT